jgi:hypothetical protein
MNKRHTTELGSTITGKGFSQAKTNLLYRNLVPAIVLYKILG